MKKTLLFTVALCLAACGSHKSNAWKDNTIHHHVVHPVTWELNDTLSITYLEDTIRGVKVGLYLHSDLDVTDNTKQAPRPDAGQLLAHEAIMTIDGEPTVIRLKNFNPVEQMIPDEIGAFNKGKRHFIGVKMSVFSFMAGGMYYVLVAEVDNQGKVIHQQGFDTDHALSWKIIQARL